MSRIFGFAAFAAAMWMSVAGAAFAGDGGAFEVGTLHVERSGERGPPVILIPGLASGSWVWKDTIAALRDEHRLYAVTLAGFDGRPPVAGDGLAQAAESLRELIVSQRLERPMLVGHSLGGTLGLMFAAKFPELVGGVVAVDGLPVFPTTENVPIAQRPALAERMRAQFTNATRSEFEAQQLAYMRRVGVIGDAQAEAIARLTSRSDPQTVGNYAAAVMALDLRPQLPAIRVPVLSIAPYYANDWTARGISEAAMAAYYESLLRGVGKLEVVTISPARHFVMLDQPQAFVEKLRKFLATR